MRRLILLAAAVALSAVLNASAAEIKGNVIRLTPSNCQSYASWSGNLVWASDLGADKEKARADLVARDEKTPASIYALLLKNLDAMWNTSAGWEEIIVVVLQDCIVRRGTYVQD